MDAANSGRAGLRLRHALAGLEAGVLGALVLAGWLMLNSLWLRRSVWSVPNLFATVVYGPNAYANYFARWSLPGLALIVVIYGALGIIWGIIWRERRNAFLSLLGAAAGLGVYVVFFRLIWPHAQPLVALYAPDRQLEAAHMLWGIVLARSPGFARSMAASADTPAGDQRALPAEIESGEVIL